LTLQGKKATVAINRKLLSGEGAYDSYLLGCESIAILPEGMSRERFDWLHKVGAEVFATPGTESNVKKFMIK